MNRIARITFSLGIILLISLGAGLSRADIIDRVVAKVNDGIITLSEVEERANLFRVNWSQVDPSQKPPSDKEIMQKAMDMLIEERLLIQEGKKLGMKVDDEKVQLAVDDIKKQNNVNDEILEKMLNRDGMTIEQYRNKIRDQIMMSQVRKYKMRGKVKISERSLRKYYKVHKKDFMDSPRVSARHILFLMPKTLTDGQRIMKREKAKDAVRQIKEGADFESLAKLYSEDESASSGGDLGVLERGKMVKEFEDAAFRLKEGEVSSVVETPYGLHIIKVDKVFPAKSLPFDKVRPKIEAFLYNKEAQEKYAEWIKEIKKEAYVESALFARNKPLNSPVQRTARLPEVKSSKKSKGRKSSATVKNRPVNPERKTSGNSGLDVDSMEKRLRYIKILKDRNIITRQEYERRKVEILNQF